MVVSCNQDLTNVRRHLNTLYVTTEGAYARKEGANVVVEVGGAERMRVPVHMLGGLGAFGRIGLSPALMGFCAEEGVTITHLSENGRFLARVEGPISGNVLLRRAQYRAADDPARPLTWCVRSSLRRHSISETSSAALCATTGQKWPNRRE
jgi:CRISPR/Cas system-associated endonuclease Cas1